MKVLGYDPYLDATVLAGYGVQKVDRLEDLLHEMRKRNARRGVATLCVSGGMGMALALEAV